MLLMEIHGESLTNIYLSIQLHVAELFCNTDSNTVHIVLSEYLFA